MSIVNTLSMKSNRQIKINFDGGNLLDEYLNDYPEITLLLRGDSGFATPVLFKQCEENGTEYVIRLKENRILREKASYLVDELDEITKANKVDYAVVYGEFMYQAGSWPYERRVVCKVEKPENQMVYMYTFIVTNMDKCVLLACLSEFPASNIFTNDTFFLKYSSLIKHSFGSIISPLNVKRELKKVPFKDNIFSFF